MSKLSAVVAIRILALSLAVVALTLGAASAHLCIIRQGPESGGVSEAGDLHGASVAAGDFNGDGYEDTAIGAPFEDISGGFTHAGAVVVNFGSEHGMTHEGALLLTEAVVGGAVESSAEFGRALAAGDFDGDGLDDLAIGVPGSALGGGSPDIGEVYVLHGDAVSGLTSWWLVTQPTGGGANEAGDRFGASLLVGNFNGDTSPAYDDLVVGAPGEDAGAGAIFYFMGTASGPVGASGWFKQSSFGYTSLAGDSFGYSLAGGNLMGDAADDLAVGAPNKDLPASNAGCVYLISGGVGSGLQSSALEYDAGDVDFPTTSGYFGNSLAAGHLMDANGFDALAIGEPNRSLADVDGLGRVIVFPGQNSGLDSSAEAVLPGYSITGQAQTNDFVGWTLCAGYFDTPDAYEDLIIGSPYLDLAAGPYVDTGKVTVAYGGPNGPGSYGYAGFNQGTLNDYVEGLEQLGASIALGDFDGTGRGSIIVGAPGEDSAAGQAHVIAPWRQVFELQCKTSAVYDCLGNLVFSQKPFEKIYPASTTKIMTTLLACERSELPPADPNHVELDSVYAIPSWVTDLVGGTQLLEPGEQITLRNLLYICMMKSANDAAYAIGDILVGGGGTAGILTYAAQMNARAAQLGMTRTHFTNGAGFTNETVGPPPGSEHYTSAEDMLKLARVAMQNPLFADIVGSSHAAFIRTAAAGMFFFECDNIINWVIDVPGFPRGNGVKTGSGTTSQWTTVVSAEGPFGSNALASTFYTPKTVGKTICHENSIDLLSLGLGECSILDWFDPVAAFEFVLGNASTLQGTVTVGATEYQGPIGADVTVDVCRTGGSGTTSAGIEIRRTSGLYLSNGQSDDFGVAPFDDHDAINIQNAGPDTTKFDVYVDYIPVGSDVYSFTLAPGAIGTIPAYGGPDAMEFAMSIENNGAFSPSDLTIEEIYRFDATFPPGPCAFSALLPRSALTSDELFQVRITGTDPIAGSSLSAIIHDGSTPVAVGGPRYGDSSAPLAPITLTLAAPNPFDPNRGAARFGFDLLEGGTVSGAVFDVSGRRVRTLPKSAAIAGRRFLEWDGRADDGDLVAGGVYFYRLESAGRHSSPGRIVVVR